MLGHQQRLGKPRHPRVPSVSHRAAQVMDGYAATRALRALGFRGLIIGVTGNALEADVAAFIAEGVDAVVSKPVSVPALLHVIEDHIEVLNQREG